jgi:hypothetical protein
MELEDGKLDKSGKIYCSEKDSSVRHTQQIKVGCRKSDVEEAEGMNPSSVIEHPTFSGTMQPTNLSPNLTNCSATQPSCGKGCVTPLC